MRLWLGTEWFLFAYVSLAITIVRVQLPNENVQVL